MTWDDGNDRVLTKEGHGRGIFFKNDILGSVEGFYCVRDNSSYFGWLCESSIISEYQFRPEQNRMPSNREITSWWTCGAEDYNTYTQAYCRQQQVPEAEERDYQRVRYDNEMNLEMWGLTFT